MSLRETSLFPVVKDSFTMVVVEFCGGYAGVARDQCTTQQNMDARLNNASSPLAGVAGVFSAFIKKYLKIEFL
jgi:hypothetical protein